MEPHQKDLVDRLKAAVAKCQPGSARADERYDVESWYVVGIDATGEEVEVAQMFLRADAELLAEYINDGKPVCCDTILRRRIGIPA